MAGRFSRTVCSPPSTSRVTSTLSPSMTTLDAKVPCGQFSSAASIWPVWLQSSSIACLPRMIRPGCSASAMALRIFATAKGSTALPSVFTRMPRSAPMASAVRMVSAACCGPIEAQTISVALPASLSRIASSTAISSNGFIDILTLPSSTPEPSALTRIFTSLSTARFTGTRIFMAARLLVRWLFCLSRGAWPAARAPAMLRCGNLPAAAPAVNVSACARTLVCGWLRAFEQGNPGRPHHHEQNGAGDQTADMRPVGDTVVGAARGVDELPDRPEADDPIGLEPKRNETEQACHLGARPEQEISGNDPGDGARGADQSRLRARIAQDEGQAGADAAGQIETEEAPATERLLDVIAEHEQEEHVAENVHEIAMHEHRGEQREERRQRTGSAAAGQRHRNQSRHLIELVHLVGPAERL